MFTRENIQIDLTIFLILFLMFSVPGIKGEYFKLMDDLGRDLFSDHYNGDLKPDAKVVT